VRMSAHRGRTYCALQNVGLDKEGTPGHVLSTDVLGCRDVVKICCLQRATLSNEVMGTAAAVVLSISFLIHYLGLRSVQWWVSVCEVAICFMMVCFRTIGSRAPFKFKTSECMYDTDLRSVGVIQPSARKQARLSFPNHAPSKPLASVVRAHLGIRDMGPQTQGDVAAALLAGLLMDWDSEKLEHLFEAVGLAHCRTAKCSISGRRVVVHIGGTGLLSKEGYIRPSFLQVWAQEINLEQIGSQSLIGWCVNGLMRNEDLEVLKEFGGIINQQIHIPAADTVVDWWLRSEGTNDWIAICHNLQWGGVLSLAILLAALALDTSEDPELEKAILNRLHAAHGDSGLIAAAVAQEINTNLMNLII